MKYTWYMFKMEKPVESCRRCPMMDKRGNCGVNSNSEDYGVEEQFANCPLIKIEGRVEE